MKVTWNGIPFIIHYAKYTKVESWYIVAADGSAVGRAVKHRGARTILLSDLHVSEAYRLNGIGLALQELREKIGRDRGCTRSCLWVERDSWMRGWYERRGYQYLCRYSDDHVWLKKKLIHTIP